MERKCQVCRDRSSEIEITIHEKSSKAELSLCLKCLRDKIKAGEVPNLHEMSPEIKQQILNAIPDDQLKPEEKTVAVKGAAFQKNETLLINKFGKDLTDQAYQKKLDPVIGREKEIDRLIRVLSRKTKNNPVLIGEPGVGKTAVIEGLAQRIVQGRVPEVLQNKHIVSLSMGSLVAGTKFRGEFEDRLKKIIEELTEEKNLILFIDEIHTVIGAGAAEGSVDAANILKPALARGEIQLIGATTLEEYRKYVEKDAALERRFQKVEVGEPSEMETVEILLGLKTKFEEFHQLKVEDKAIEAASHFAQRYIPDRFMPDKAVDLLDEACAYRKMIVKQKSNESYELEAALEQAINDKNKAILGQIFDQAQAYKMEEERLRIQVEKARKQDQKRLSKIKLVVTEEDVAIVVSEWTGIPTQRVSESDRTQMKQIEEELKKMVKGQDKAVAVIAKSIRRNKLGLKDPKRPVGVFMMVGPTGVGKTELAKSVAKTIYGSEDAMIRFDMSEYREPHTTSKLIGAPPGYVGFEDDGKLTKLLRRKPYSLVLFDEIEKAHPDVCNLLLQLFEDGHITDSKGRVIDGKNAIFLLTSNAGSEIYQKQKHLGFQTNDDTMQKNIQEQVGKKIKEAFKPEFINRMDEIIYFDPLSKEVMLGIARKLVDQFCLQVREQGFDIFVDNKTLDYLATVGYDPEYGARKLRRELDKMKDAIADFCLQEENVQALVISVQEAQYMVKIKKHRKK
jgi:ATP-dependent Clp protease ATP-binding subunit ClpC